MKIQNTIIFTTTFFTSTFAGFTEMLQMYNSKARNNTNTRGVRPGMPGLRNLGMEIALGKELEKCG